MRVYPGRQPIGLEGRLDLEMPRMELEALVEQNFDPATETFGLWESRGVCAEMEPGVKTWRGCWHAEFGS